MPQSTKDKGFKANDNFLLLRDISHRDRGWDFNRSAANFVGDYYRRAGYKKLAERVYTCARRLTFNLTKDCEGTVSLKLKTVFLCKVRLCPICQKARLRVKQVKLFQAIPKLIQQNKTMRFLFLTLTVKNCDIKKLRETTRLMSRAFTKMMKRSCLNNYVKGYLKSLEITKSKIYEAHPHFHVLIAVNSDYFSRGYITQGGWTELWKDALGIEYTPIVNIKKISSDDLNLSQVDRVSNAIKEVSKYMIKPMDIIGKGTKKDCQFFIDLSNQISGVKAFNCAGIFLEYLKDREESEDEILEFTEPRGEGDEEKIEDEPSTIEFFYNTSNSSYCSDCSLPF